MKHANKIVLAVWFSFLLAVWFLSSLLVTGCGTPKAVVTKETTTEKITEKVHDTVFRTEKDSSMLQALLDCQNGKVVVKEVITAEAGNHLNAPKATIKDNVLTVDCEARAQELFAQWKSKEITRSEVIEKPVLVTNPLTFTQKLFINLGKILCLLILLLTGWGIYKLYKKIRP